MLNGLRAACVFVAPQHMVCRHDGAEGGRFCGHVEASRNGGKRAIDRSRRARGADDFGELIKPMVQRDRRIARCGVVRRRRRGKRGRRLVGRWRGRARRPTKQARHGCLANVFTTRRALCRRLVSLRRLAAWIVRRKAGDEHSHASRMQGRSAADDSAWNLAALKPTVGIWLGDDAEAKNARARRSRGRSRCRGALKPERATGQRQLARFSGLTRRGAFWRPVAVIRVHGARRARSRWQARLAQAHALVLA